MGCGAVQVIDDPDIRRQLAEQARLWLLSLVRAALGTITMVTRGSLAAGVLVFLLSVTVLGAALWAYERRGRKPD